MKVQLALPEQVRPVVLVSDGSGLSVTRLSTPFISDHFSHLEVTVSVPETVYGCLFLVAEKNRAVMYLGTSALVSSATPESSR